MVARNNYGLECWLLELIGQARSEHAFPLLAAHLHSPDESFRGWAVTGLENLGAKGGTPTPLPGTLNPGTAAEPTWMASRRTTPCHRPANETTTSNSDGRSWVLSFQRRVRPVPAAAGTVGRESSASSRGPDHERDILMALFTGAREADSRDRRPTRPAC